MSEAKKAVILVSGGLDSATVLAIAKAEGYECYAMSFAYGQRHAVEVEASERVCDSIGVEEHRVVPIDLSVFGGSALTDNALRVPKSRSEAEMLGGIPITYVPARNTIFLSFALAWAEVLAAHTIFIGVNAVDYSGYPDCRPEFINAYERMANLGTAYGVVEGGEAIRILAPLQSMSKREIIAQGLDLDVDYSLTLSCYDPDETGIACGSCDSCQLRQRGFIENGMRDPAPYQKSA